MTEEKTVTRRVVRPAQLLTAVLATVLTVTVALPADARRLDPAAEKSRPAVQVTKPVPVRAVSARPTPGQRVALPTPKGRVAAASAASEVPPAEGFVAVASGQVQVAALADAPAALRRGTAPSPAVPEGLRVAVDAADRPGMSIDLTAQAKGSVSVRIPFGQFGNRYGGDWASRLVVRDVSACPRQEPCREAPVLRAVRDDAARTLTTVVALDAPAAGTAARTSGASAPATAALAVEAAASGTSGSFAATDLSAAGAWSSGGQGGEMGWSYPLRVPPSAGGLDPDLSLSYSSGAVDGRTTSTNNQPSWVGEGFDLSTGFIERRYTGCADESGSGSNNATKTGDLCWKTDAGKTNDEKWDNATVSFGGHSGELVRIGNTSSWRLRFDDGTRFEKLTGASNGDQGGEYWRMTTDDGTQYFFGRGRGSSPTAAATLSTWTVPVFGNNPGEPDYVAGDFAGSVRTEAWRWNLDQVVSPDGDAVTYYYAQDTNRYQKLAGMSAAASVQYVRGGRLERIDYGQRSGAEHVAAGAQVLFGSVERCFNDTALADCQSATMTSTNAYHWPDVPFDQICSSTTSCSVTTQGSPTFFSRTRLASVTTQVRNAADTGYDQVDRFDLTPAYPDPGDGTTAALTLSKLTHTGLAGGSIAEPPVQFVGAMMANRVDGIDNSGPLNKWRIYSILSGSGENLSWTYSAEDCTPTSLPTPETNTRRCFPVFWTPEGQQAQEKHWFHKYVVTQVRREDLSQSSEQQEVTSYEYLDSPAWHYDDSVLTPAKYRTWGDWRGYSRVRTTTGASPQTRSQSETRFFRGMDGDRASAAGGTKTVQLTDSQGTAVTDHWRLQGATRETVTFTGPGGTEVGSSRTDPWLPSAATADDGTETAMLTGAAVARSRVALAAGGFRETRVNTTFDSYGDPVAVEDLGQVTPAKVGDETCTRTTYVRNTTAWITATPSEIKSLAGDCQADQATASALSHQRTYYDAATSLTAAPTRGNPTRSEALVDTPTGRVFRTTSSSTVDIHGRPVTTTDAKQRTSSTTYTPATGTPVRQVATSTPDPDGAGPLTPLTSSQVIDPRWGTTVSATAANGSITEAAFDALGRTTAVWLPGRNRATFPTAPSNRYSYAINASGPNAVTSEALNARGTYTTSVQILDGLLRQRQTQTTPAAGTGRLVTDTLYDSRGNATVTRGPILDTTSGPATGVVTFADLNTPLITEDVIDGAGRTTAAITRVRGVEKWRTTTTYGGDRVTVDPPDGGIPTTTISDADGKTTQLLQYTSGSPTGTSRSTSYGYDLLGRMTRVTDDAGNAWTYTFDLQGQLVQSTDPDKGLAKLGYDEVGNVTSSVDARNQELRFTYDALDRKTAVTNADGTPRATWSYDVLSNGTAAKGLSTGSSRYVGTSQVKMLVAGYDTGNRPTGSDIVVPAVSGQIETQLAGTYTTRYTYKADGSPSTTTYGAAGPLTAERLTYVYDTLGMPDSVGGSGSYVADTVYSPYGEVLQLAMGNTIGAASYQTLAYEEGTRRLQQAQVDRQAVAGTDEVTDLTYDPAGNPTKVQATVLGGTKDTQCYRYGERAQLTEAWTPSSGDCAAAPTQAGLGGPAPYWQSWTQDRVGNLLTFTDRTATTSRTTTQTYPTTVGSARPHFSLTANTVGSTTRTRSFTADASGNTLTRVDNGVSQTLTWDPEGHLTKVTGSATVAEYLYDQDGNRLTRRQGGKTTLYLGATELTYTASTGAVTAQRYYSFAGRTVAVRKGTTNADVSTLFGDSQNTAVHSVANTTSALTVRRSTPYGGTRGAAVTWNGDHGFLDGPTDSSTALTHLGAREYDPSLGRFLSVDPVLDVTDPLQMNAYTYGQNNPITMSDPDGRRPVGAGDSGCSNCRVVTRKSASGKVTQSWKFGNEHHGARSVYGKRSTSYKYRGGSNYRTSTATRIANHVGKANQKTVSMADAAYGGYWAAQTARQMGDLSRIYSTANSWTFSARMAGVNGSQETLRAINGYKGVAADAREMSNSVKALGKLKGLKGAGAFAVVGFGVTVASDEKHDVTRAAVSTGAGLLGSIAAGAAVGAVAGSPAFGIGAVPGAVIGAVVGLGVGLYTSGVAESIYDKGPSWSSLADGGRSVVSFFTDW